MKKILFDGDSITDCFRNSNLFGEDSKQFNNNLGFGLPSLVMSMLDTLSNEEYIYQNNALAGDTTTSLLKRIKEAKDFKADYYVLLIGINDVWFNYDKKPHGTTDEDFKKNYNEILTHISNSNPNCKFIVQTLSYFPKKGDEIKGMAEEVARKNEIIKQVASNYNCLVVDINTLMKDKINLTRRDKWFFNDGIHYNLSTNMLVAERIFPLFI